MQGRISRLVNKYEDNRIENVEINEELDAINRQVRTFEQEIGDTTSIQNDVTLDLKDRIDNYGLYISSRWRLLGSSTNNNFYVSDMLNSGFYRFVSTSDGGDVVTINN